MSCTFANTLAYSSVLACALAACATHPSAPGPAQVADAVTRAVYANDLDSTVADFDAAAKRAVTRGELGELSDKMHALGDLKSIAQRSADPDSGKYEYDAAFTSGSMLVQLRMDPDGKVGAYRVVPSGTPAAAASAGG